MCGLPAVDTYFFGLHRPVTPDLDRIVNASSVHLPGVLESLLGDGTCIGLILKFTWKYNVAPAPN